MAIAAEVASPMREPTDQRQPCRDSRGCRCERPPAKIRSHRMAAPMHDAEKLHAPRSEAVPACGSVTGGRCVLLLDSSEPCCRHMHSVAAAVPLRRTVFPDRLLSSPSWSQMFPDVYVIFSAHYARLSINSAATLKQEELHTLLSVAFPIFK